MARLFCLTLLLLFLSGHTSLWFVKASILGDMNLTVRKNCTDDQKILQLIGLTNGSHYDQHRIPEYGMPILVGARVHAITEVNDVTQDFVLDVFMAESWVDSRLRFDHLNPCKANISLSKEIYRKMWTPNTCFINSKKAYIHESPFKNLYIILFDKGIIWTQYRATLKDQISRVSDNRPVNVTIGVRVQSVLEVNDVAQDFVVDMFFAELWQDPRLDFISAIELANRPLPCRYNISLTMDTYKYLWKPNTVFTNSKFATIHESPFRNMFIMIIGKGFVWTEYRATFKDQISRVSDNRPVNVTIGVRVQSVLEVNDVAQDFVVDMFFAELWQDPRLDFISAIELANRPLPCRYNISLTMDTYKYLWKPNTVFTNSKFATIHESPFRNMFIMIIGKGFVWTEYRATFKGMLIMVGANIQAILEINDITQDFVVDMFLAEAWRDPRLDYAVAINQSNKAPACRNNLSLSMETYDRLWTPNTVFINSKRAYIHESPFRNMFVLLMNSGLIWTQYRATLRGPCNVELSGFPMDTQQCYLTFESFSYSTMEVKMRWINMPIKIDPEKRFLKEFYVSKTNATRDEVSYPAGLWDEMTMTFTIQRRYGWYILNVYIPTYLTVFISWISFFLGDKAIPARTMIGVNALLAMTFQFGSVIRNLPRVSHVKAIDVWMLTGMSFVFASLLELAVVGWRTRIQDDNKEKPKKSALVSILPPVEEPLYDTTAMATYEPGCDVCDGFGSFRRARYRPPAERRKIKLNCCASSVSAFEEVNDRISIEKIDRFSAHMFPILFALFNIAYWTYYLSWTQYGAKNLEAS